MIDGDCSSNSPSRSICALRFPRSYWLFFQERAQSFSNLLHHCSAVLGIYVNAVAPL